MTKQLMVAIVESQRVRVWISKWKIKCFRVENVKFVVLRHMGGTKRNDFEKWVWLNSGV